MKAVFGATGDDDLDTSARDELFLVVLDRVPKDLATDLLTACAEVLADHGYQGTTHRTESGGYLLAGHKTKGST